MVASPCHWELRCRSLINDGDDSASGRGNDVVIIADVSWEHVGSPGRMISFRLQPPWEVHFTPPFFSMEIVHVFVIRFSVSEWWRGEHNFISMLIYCISNYKLKTKHGESDNRVARRLW